MKASAKRMLLKGALAAWPVVLLRADTISPNVNNVLAGMPANATFAANTNTGNTPFWDNVSYDGSQMNIGYFLTGTGAFNGGPVFFPNGAGQYLSAAGTGGQGQPLSFSLVRDALSLNVTILYQNSAGNGFGAFGTSFGLYDVSNPANRITLYSAGTIPANVGGSGQNVNTPFANYGFFATSCPGGPVCFTFFSDTALNPAIGMLEGGGNAAHQHFGLLSLASSPTVFYLGYEDSLGPSGWSGVNGFEHLGEYNDIIFRITTAQTAPEPGTFAFLGAGLAALIVARLRKATGQREYPSR